MRRLVGYTIPTLSAKDLPVFRNIKKQIYSPVFLSRFLSFSFWRALQFISFFSFLLIIYGMVTILMCVQSRGGRDRDRERKRERVPFFFKKIVILRENENLGYYHI